MDDNKVLVLIDGHALAFRMFFALERTNMQTTEHQPTWAIYGFFKAIFDLLNAKHHIVPNAIAVAFDVSRKTFRLEKFEGYKANRETMPDTLRSQLGLIMEGLQALNIPIYVKEGFEGDDIIGTIAHQAKALGHKVIILTGDKDSFQLIDEEGDVRVLIPSKGELLTYDWERVKANLDIYPNQVVDYKALSGDTSDNIPGVKGIGPKTASSLLNEYQTLDNVYENIENITKKSVKEKLIGQKENAYLSQFLATIKLDVDINFDFNTTCLEIEKKQNVIDFFKKMQFFSFQKNIDSLLTPFICKDSPKNAPQEDIVMFKDEEPEQTSLFGQLGLTLADEKPIEKIETNEIPYEDFVKNLDKTAPLSFFIQENMIHLAQNATVTSTFANLAKELLQDSSIQKITHDIKTALDTINPINGLVEDIMLSSYVKDSSRKHDLVSQAQSYLGYTPESPAELAIAILNLSTYFEKNLNENEKNLLKEVELPLAFVLKHVENTGVSIDCPYLKTLSEEIDKKVQAFEETIYAAAGTTFNINSPKQVADVLFQVLEIKPKKKNKTGFSTSAKILEDLAEEHQIAKDILEHRQLMKLKTTYIDSLPKLLAEDGKIHTHYNQIITTTGRLSSSEPNLQNIPIRTEFSNRIRSAFIPSSEDFSILAADYSQIELRLLAHISGDKTLIEAFKDDTDIHTITASKIFDIPESEITKEMRRKAKAVNFGLIYGQTRYGLAGVLKISPFEAQDFIDKYFRTYPRINSYITNTLMQAHSDGYVETIYGRRRYLSSELNSRNAKIREFAERAAINAPLQGSSADLIKIAMVRLDERLKNLESKMILQVHDELVLEVKNSEIETVKTIVRECMELDQPLNVPLKIDIKVGSTWKDSK